MDVAGEPGRRLARSAANTSAEGGAVLNQAIDERFEGQTQRLSDWLNSTFNYPNAALQQQALERSQSITDNANYARAMREGSRGIWNPELERLASSDIVANAMKKAASVTRDESVIGGYAGMNPNISFTADGRIQFARGPGGVPTYPDLQFWDLTRRQLSNSAQMMLQRGDNEEARRFGIFAQRLNTALDREVPSYQAARAGHEAASPLGLMIPRAVLIMGWATMPTPRATAGAAPPITPPTSPAVPISPPLVNASAALMPAPLRTPRATCCPSVFPVRPSSRAPVVVAARGSVAPTPPAMPAAVEAIGCSCSN
jgi:hypothetical protein